jgi:hypothetical protein
MPLEKQKICTNDMLLKTEKAKKKAGKGKTKTKTRKQILNHLTTLNKPSTGKTEVISIIFNKPYFTRKKVIDWMNKHYKQTCYKIGETQKTREAKVANITKKEQNELFREYRNMITQNGVRMLIGVRKYSPILKNNITKKSKNNKSKTKKNK